MKYPTVAIVGSPNVGKSTLFNKIVGKKISITEDIPGITRDRIYEKTKYENKIFYLIDTGGIDDEKVEFNNEIKMQAEIAIDEADVIIFVVDGKLGVTNNDRFISKILRKSNKKIVVAVNKFDTKVAKDNLYDFYELGFDNYIPISSIHNIGYNDLLETVTSNFLEKEEVTDNNLKIAIIGRPNVGKSSLVNALVNEERVLTSPIAGTTRDSINTILKYNNEDYTLIDTAGMRKKGKIYEKVEKYSLIRSLKAIDEADIALIVLNAEEGITEHDKHIAGYAKDAGIGMIFVVNKWDLSKTDINEFKKLIKYEFQFATFAPIIFLSALTKKRIHTLMPEVIKVSSNIKKEVKTSLLNDILQDAYSLNLPPSYKGERLKIFFSSQTGIKPPKFTIRVNSKKLIHFSYERYLENKIRENIDFTGTPIILKFKNRSDE